MQKTFQIIRICFVRGEFEKDSPQFQALGDLSNQLKELDRDISRAQTFTELLEVLEKQKCFSERLEKLMPSPEGIQIADYHSSDMREIGRSLGDRLVTS